MISLHRLKEVLHYDPDTGLFTWRVTISNVKAGTVAGRQRPNKGYVVITIDGVKYYAHRLAWFYMTAQWPEELIDHRDTVKNNNKWDNLRLSTTAQNGQNRRAQKNNKSGIKGVCWDAAAGKWLAQIVINGERECLGRYPSKAQAASAYQEAALRGHGDFARL